MATQLLTTAAPQIVNGNIVVTGLCRGHLAKCVMVAAMDARLLSGGRFQDNQGAAQCTATAVILRVIAFPQQLSLGWERCVAEQRNSCSKVLPCLRLCHLSSFRY